MFPGGLSIYGLYLDSLSDSYWNHIIFLLFIVFGIFGVVWAIALTSILGKVLFGGALFLIYFQFNIFLAVVLAVTLLIRLFILWYLPTNISNLSAFLSRLELLNRQLDVKEVKYEDLIENNNMDLISRLTTVGYLELNNLLYHALEMENHKLVVFFLNMGAEGNLESGGHQTMPELKSIFLDELNKDNSLENSLNLADYTSDKVYRFNLQSNYISLLEENPEFWMRRFKKLFAGKVHISSSEVGYILILSKHRHMSKLSKDSKISRKKEELISTPVAVLRVKDQIEEDLQRSFFQPPGGNYTFPFDLSTIPCDSCGGRGLLDCSAGCDGGKVKCSNSECKEGLMKCYECRGEGRIIRTCRVCEDGYKKCEVCGAKGYLECENCEGKGSVIVEIMENCTCHKEWKIKCPECDGNGRQKGYICTLCSGIITGARQIF